MKRFLLPFLLLLLISSGSFASNVQTSRPILYMDNGQAYTVFNLSWDNAWHNNRNHDAVWLFFKALPDDEHYHQIKVAAEGHSMVANFGEQNPTLGFETASDGMGIFVYPQNNFRGNIKVSIKVQLQPESFASFDPRRVALKAYGIEMVHIPKGPFELGDPDPKALPFGSIYKADAEGQLAGLPRIESEDQVLNVGLEGDLYYQARRGYEGDQQGTIPASYPKGFAAFYMMKYEVTEGQFIDFLISLRPAARQAHLIYEAQHYYDLGGSLKAKGQSFTSPSPDKPCKFLSWDDAMAYADWAGLRPMTEFEFTKAARGPERATAGAFPWSGNSRLAVQRLPDPDGNLQMINGWTEAQLNDETRAYFAASHYWVLDLSGSLWERLITIGHPKGRAFDGSHGDGVLTEEGLANENWPTGEENSGGIGYRGGGFYGYYRNYHEYNPFSPIAYRPYGGWHGAMRSQAYGTRFVRTK